MAGYNQVTMLGNLTSEPQLSYTPSQTPVVDTGLAVNRKWSSNGSSHEETCFIDVRFWSKLAEVVAKHLHKGSRVLVQGYLAFEQWEGKDDHKKHSKHRLVAQSVQFLDAPPDRREAGDDQPVPDEDIPF